MTESPDRVSAADDRAQTDDVHLAMHSLNRSERVAAGERVRTELQRLRDTVARYERSITWNTTCAQCATYLDASIKDYERAEKADAERDRLRDTIQDVTDMHAPTTITVLHWRCYSGGCACDGECPEIEVMVCRECSAAALELDDERYVDSMIWPCRTALAARVAAAPTCGHVRHEPWSSTARPNITTTYGMRSDTLAWEPCVSAAPDGDGNG